MAHGAPGEPGAGGTRPEIPNATPDEPTPGPWGIGAAHTGEDDIDIYDDGGMMVARAIGSRDDPDQGSAETWANAKLIAAAPALLEALKEIRQHAAPLVQSKDPLGQSIERIAKAAIEAAS